MSMTVDVQRQKRAGAGRSNVLWRQGDWRCEYAAHTQRASGGTVSIYLGGTLAAQQETQCLVEMLDVARLWRDTFAGADPAALQKVAWALAPDRRTGPNDRRGSARGERRIGDV